MKKLLFIFTMAMLMCNACQKDSSSNNNNGDDDVLVEVTTLTNGDVIFMSEDDAEYVVEVELSDDTLTIPTSMQDYVDGVFDYTFTMSESYTYDEVSFTTQITLKENSENWALCLVESDDLITVLNDVDYDAESGVITADMTIAQENSEATVRLAMVKVGALISNVELEHNPSGRNILCAAITFESTLNVAPQMTLKGQDDNDIVKDFESGTDHEIGVLGLYNDYTNQIYVDCTFSDWGIAIRKEFEVTVSDQYLDIYDISVMTRSENLANSSSDIYVCSGIASNTAYDSNGMRVMTIGFDEYGKIRWLYRDTYAGTIRSYPVEYKGTKARFTTNANNSFTSTDGSKQEVKVYDYYGNTLVAHEVDGLQNLHHDALLIDDSKTIVVPESKLSNGSDDESVFLEISLETGEIISSVDLDDVIDDDRAIQIIGVGSSGEDRVHINSIDYSSSDDCYVISMRKQGVVKIKRGATSKDDIIWWMTSHNDVSEEWESTLLTPTNFENVPENWNMGQHSAYILDNGDIMMFDNHNEAQGNEGSYRQVSRVLTMSVDETEMTVESIYEWETPDSKYCNIMSNVLMHPSTNSFVSGWATEKCVYETSYPDGEVLFYAMLNDFDTNIYRFYKTDLYE